MIYNQINNNSNIQLIQRNIKKEVNSLITFVSSMGYAGCSTLLEVSFPNASIIYHDAFWQCYSLSKAIFSNLQSIESYAFQSCHALSDINISIFSNISKIETCCFEKCSSLLSISFPNCTTIDAKAFNECYSLSLINFPKCTTIGSSAFQSCSALTTADFPSCISISNSAFGYCSSLTTISFPNCSYIGGYAFRPCRSLTAASFPNCSYIGTYAFAGCSSLATISFPNCEYVGHGTFQACYSLTTANFPNCTTVSNYGFVNCYSLSTISFPNCISIGYNAFQCCTSLASVDFPKCTYISMYAFQSCISLTTASFSKCSYIGGSVFSDCYNLISLYLNSVSSVPKLDGATSRVFYSTPIGGYSDIAGRYGSVYVPSSLYNSFLTATNWSNIAARIVSIVAPRAAFECALDEHFSSLSYIPSNSKWWYRIPVSMPSKWTLTNVLAYKIITSTSFPVTISGLTDTYYYGPRIYVQDTIPSTSAALLALTPLFSSTTERSHSNFGQRTIDVPSGNFNKYLIFYAGGEYEDDNYFAELEIINRAELDNNYYII